MLQNDTINEFLVTIGVGSTEIDIIEDYILNNFNSIVSSVGGSLGLFLGFSFYSCGLSILSKFWSK
jgi:hypothetical protein